MTANSWKQPLLRVASIYCWELQATTANSCKQPLLRVTSSHCWGLQAATANSCKLRLLRVASNHCWELQAATANSCKQPLLRFASSHCWELQAATANICKQPLLRVANSHYWELQADTANSWKQPLLTVASSTVSFPLHTMAGDMCLLVQENNLKTKYKITSGKTITVNKGHHVYFVIYCDGLLHTQKWVKYLENAPQCRLDESTSGKNMQNCQSKFLSIFLT